MADINSYALNMTFNISSNASVILDDVQSKLTDIQDQFNTVASTISGNLTDAAANLDSIMSGLASSTATVSGHARSMGPNFADATRNVGDMQDHWESIFEGLDDAVENFDEIRDQSEDIEAIHRNMSRLYEDNNDELVETERSARNVSSSFNGAASSILSVAGALFALKQAFYDAWKEEDQYNTIGRRVHGTQLEMSASARQLALETRVFGDKAQEAMIAISENIRFTNDDLMQMETNYRTINNNITGFVDKNKLARDELKKYTELAAKFNVVTGVSVELVAEYMAKMKAVGLSFGDTEAMMNRMVAGFKAAGMSAKEISAIIQGQADKAVETSIVWGEEGAKGVRKYETELVALYKSMNLDSKHAQEFSQAVSTNIQAIGFRKRAAAELGYTWDEVQASSEKSLEVQGKASQEIAKLIVGMQQNADTNTLPLVYERIAQQFGVTKEAALQLSKVYGETSLTAAEVAAKLREIDPDYDDQTALNDQYAKSINTVQKAWNELIDESQAVWKELMVVLGPAIMFLINNVLKPLVKTLGWVVSWFKGTSLAMKETSQETSGIIGWFTWLWDTIKGLGGGFVALGLSIAGMWAAWSLAKVAIGLWEEFMEATKADKLLAIAAAAIAVGAGMLLLAFAFQILADLGWGVIPPLMVMGVVLAGLVIAIYALSDGSAVTIPVMHALADVFLAMGAGALMMSAGLYVTAAAFSVFMAAAAPVLDDPAKALNFMAFAAAVLAGATLLGPAAAILAVVGPAMVIGMTALNTSLWMLNIDRFASIAKSFDMLGSGFEKLGDNVKVAGDIRSHVSNIVSALNDLDDIEKSVDVSKSLGDIGVNIKGSSKGIIDALKEFKTDVSGAVDETVAMAKDIRVSFVNFKSEFKASIAEASEVSKDVASDLKAFKREFGTVLADSFDVSNCLETSMEASKNSAIDTITKAYSIPADLMKSLGGFKGDIERQTSSMSESVNKLSGSLVSSYAEIGNAIDSGLGLLESRADQSSVLFGRITKDFSEMSTELDRMSIGIRAKRLAEQAVKRQYEVSVAQSGKLAQDSESKQARSEPVQSTLIRDDHLSELRDKRDAEIRHRDQINQLRKMADGLASTAENTTALAEIRNLIKKQESDVRPQTSIGGSHVTTWS